MSGRALMTASGVFLIGAGIVMNFAAGEVAAAVGLAAGGIAPLIVQLLAGLCLGMGVINWMWRGNAFGGIYGRPIGVGNVLQFVVGSFALVRAASATPAPGLIALAIVYAVFAAWFAFVVFWGGAAGSQSKA